jgi:hypothetical protein
MTFWDKFTNFVNQLSGSSSKKYLAYFLEPHRVDVNADTAPVEAGKTYCRVWLVEMRLAKGREWFSQRYPTVHSAVRITYAGKPQTIPYLAGPGFIKELTKENLDKIIQCNHPLTPLFPFNEGLVELQSGLFSVSAGDALQKLLSTLGRFSKLLPVPQFSTVLDIASPLYDGIEDLLGLGGNEFELGYQQNFAPGGGGGFNELRSGYFVAILAEEKSPQNPDGLSKEKLCVVQDGLYTGAPGQNREFLTKKRELLEGYSYMLFRMETRSSQHWESLANIKKLVDQALDLTVKGEHNQVKQVLLPTIKSEIFRSPDVAREDRKEMVRKIEATLKEWGLEGLVTGQRPPGVTPSLNVIMQRPLPPLEPGQAHELEVMEALFGGKMP